MKRRTARKWFSVMLAVCMAVGSMAYAVPLRSEAAAVTRRMANVVVFVNFNDTSHDSHEAGRCYVKDGGAQLTRDLFDGDETKPRAMKQYLKNISYGQLEVENIFPQMDGDKLEIYTLQNNMNYYLNAGKNMDSYIIQEVMTQLEESRKLTQNPSLDGDGIVDNLTIVLPCESGTKNTQIIGHQADFAGDQTIHRYSGAQAGRGYIVRDYVILPEDNTYTLAHPSVITHEFLHAVGYPDLYRQAVLTGEENPVGVWDIMGAVGRHPHYPLAYLRSSITKWFDIPTVTTSQKGYSLYAASAATEVVKDRQAVVLRTSYSDTEFFVLEYRKKGEDYNNSYDYLLPGSGLIIYRVNTRYWGNHHDEGDMIYVMRPGDKYDSKGREQGSNIYSAYLSETSYGSSDPGKSLEDNAIVYSDGTNSGIVISNIGKAGGDQITFDISFAENTDAYWKTAASQDKVHAMASYMDADGAIYSLLRKDDGMGPVYLYRYDQNGWTQYGSAPIRNSGNRSIALGKYGGSFYAGYLNASFRFTLDRWTGASWQNVYTASDQCYDFAMTSSTDGIYLAYPEANSQNMYAYRYSGSGMEKLGSYVGQGRTSTPSISSENGKTVAMYRDGQEGLHVKSYDSSARTWKDVGALSLKGSYGIVRLHKNRVYLLRSGVWGESIGDLYMCDLSDAGGTWRKVGNGPFANESVSAGDDICFYGDDPHVVYMGGSSKTVWVKSLVNGAWTTLGSKVANETAFGLQIFSHGGMIYTTYYGPNSNLAYIRMHTVNSSGKAPEGGSIIGGNTGGTTGGNSGSTSGGTTGGNSGSTSGGTTGGNSGSTSGGNSGNTSGGSGGSTSGGTTGGNSGNTSGGTIGGSSGNTSGGTTGGSSGNTSGSNTGNTGSISGGGAVKPVTPPQPADPSGIKNITARMTRSTTLQLNWTPVSGAISYEVYYSTSQYSGYKRLATAKTNSYRFAKAKCGETYYFKIRTISKSGRKKVYGEFSLPVSGRTVLSGAPSVYVSRATYNSITIKWSKVQDAKKYEIYYSTSPNGAYSLLKTQGGTSFTHKGLQTGAVYYYKVRPMRDYYKGSYSNQASARTVLGSVTNLKASPSGYDKMKVSWRKVPGVNYYVVLRSDSPYGAYKQIGVTNRTSLVDTNLPSGTAYYYKVYAVSGPYQTNTAGPVRQVTKIKKK